ncbi:MAG: histidine phosphatase family protein [Chitinophagaceae bacterium]|nr:histidine phosphatase family protein [Chitinophagaceae bacterium]
MKTLLLIRHAKSDWSHPELEDFDRPLNERGKKDAPEMARRLIKNKIKIDLFLSSPAKRAASTAKAFLKEFDAKKKKLRFEEKLYLPSPSVFWEVIKDVKDKVETLAVFSHNDGITLFANQLTNTKVDNIPTCGIFAVKAHCDAWKDFENSEKEFWFFDYPKAEAKNG